MHKRLPFTASRSVRSVSGPSSQPALYDVLQILAFRFVYFVIFILHVLGCYLLPSMSPVAVALSCECSIGFLRITRVTRTSHVCLLNAFEWPHK
jgi:hypothetical protein